MSPSIPLPGCQRPLGIPIHLYLPLLLGGWHTQLVFEFFTISIFWTWITIPLFHCDVTYPHFKQNASLFSSPSRCLQSKIRKLKCVNSITSPARITTPELSTPQRVRSEIPGIPGSVEGGFFGRKSTKNEVFVERPSSVNLYLWRS